MLLKTCNSSLSFGQAAALTFCLPGALSITSYLLILLENDLRGLLPIGQVSFNPFAAGDFAEKRVLKLVEWFSGRCHAIKS